MWLSFQLAFNLLGLKFLVLARMHSISTLRNHVLFGYQECSLVMCLVLLHTQPWQTDNTVIASGAWILRGGEVGIFMLLSFAGMTKVFS